MEERSLRVVELKEDINWLYLVNQDTKNNDSLSINIKPLLLLVAAFF